MWGSLGWAGDGGPSRLFIPHDRFVIWKKCSKLKIDRPTKYMD
jgi:hypothetical protein